MQKPITQNDIVVTQSVKKNIHSNSPVAIYQRISHGIHVNMAAHATFVAAQNRKCRWHMMFGRLHVDEQKKKEIIILSRELLSLPLKANLQSQSQKQQSYIPVCVSALNL